jgi:hypothetical protein
MKLSRLGIFLVTLAIVVIGGPILDALGQVRELPPQNSDKSLDITRYSNEPLELVDLKVGEQGIKNKIASKFRSDGAGLDTVTFKERNGWFKRISVTMRNVSGSPIYGLRAYLYFIPPGSRTLYSLPLRATTILNKGVAEPGSEITLTVSEQAWSLTTDILDKHDVNPDLASVEFSIEYVRFASDLQWSKGQLLRRDPNNPNKWNVIDMKDDP